MMTGSVQMYMLRSRPGLPRSYGREGGFRCQFVAFAFKMDDFGGCPEDFPGGSSGSNAAAVPADPLVWPTGLISRRGDMSGNRNKTGWPVWPAIR